MTDNKKYQPLDAMEYPRFEGIRTFMRLPHVTELEDVDFAAEAANLAKNQILAQSGKAMRAQASAISQNILGLLA